MSLGNYPVSSAAISDGELTFGNPFTPGGGGGLINLYTWFLKIKQGWSG